MNAGAVQQTSCDMDSGAGAADKLWHGFWSRCNRQVVASKLVLLQQTIWGMYAGAGQQTLCGIDAGAVAADKVWHG
jgi:hypothetical protein